MKPAHPVISRVGMAGIGTTHWPNKRFAISFVFI